MQPGQSGWSRTQPSYEEHYVIEQPVGKPSPIGEGWSFPALFKTPDNVWVLLCDSDVNEQYCATRLPMIPLAGYIISPFRIPKNIAANRTPSVLKFNCRCLSLANYRHRPDAWSCD
jgi:hypothetical protein